MSIPLEFWWFALCIWVAFSTEVATGFGSIIIALALGALLLPFEAMLPVLVCLNVIMNSVLLSRLHRHLVTRVFFRQIIPLMLVGMAIGVALFPILPEQGLKLGFALLVLWFSAKALLTTQPSAKKMPMMMQKAWTFLAGITHGLYASGGPLLVYGLSKSSMNKQEFRATLLATWCTLNACYAVWFGFQGELTKHVTTLLWMLPVLLLAAATGQYLHLKVNEARFKQMVYVVLLLCGSVMVAQSLY